MCQFIYHVRVTASTPATLVGKETDIMAKDIYHAVRILDAQFGQDKISSANVNHGKCTALVTITKGNMIVSMAMEPTGKTVWGI